MENICVGEGCFQNFEKRGLKHLFPFFRCSLEALKSLVKKQPPPREGYLQDVK